jgi:hypothetical protein
MIFNGLSIVQIYGSGIVKVFSSYRK